MKSNDKIPFMDYIQQLNQNIGDNKIMAYSDEFFKKLDKKALTELVYRNLFIRLENIVLKMYKWKADSNVDPRTIELGLLWNGWMCAFDSPVGKLVLPCNPTNFLNVYGNPNQVRVYGWNGWQDTVNIDYDFESPVPEAQKDQVEQAKKLTQAHGIFMRDNDLAYPYINYVKEYAYKLTDKLMALNVAFQRLKSPFVYVVDEKELKDTVSKLVEKIESNDDVIVRLKGNKLQQNAQDNVRLEKNQMNPDILTKMREVVMFDFNQFIETIGINTNPSPDKSQYTNITDSNSNNSLVDIEQDVRFLNRQEFCDKAKKVGITLSVEKNTDEAKEEAMKMQKELAGAMGEGGKGDEKQKSNPISK